MDKNKRDKKKRGKESTSGGEKSTSQSATASSPQATEPTSQPVQPIPGEKPINPLMAKLFPMSTNRTPNLAQILSVRGRCPGTEDSNDPLKIPPDVLDMIMDWDIDEIFANSKHVRMPYTRNFPTEESTLESPRVAEELSSAHALKEFKPRSMLETDADATSGSKGKGKGKKSKAAQDQPSVPVTKPEEVITQQAAATPPQVEETDLSSKISPDDVYSVAPYNRPNRQSNTKGFRGRGESYKPTTPRATYPRPAGTLAQQYPPLPPPQRPYVPQKNQWPSLGAPRQSYQSRDNFQDNTRQGQHQGKPSSRGRGKTVFKKFSRNLEPMEQIDEAAPPAEGLDVKPRIEEEKPKEEKPKKEKPKEEIVPKEKVEIPKQPEKCQLHKEVQANAAKEETVRGGYTREEPIAIDRYYRNENSKYYRRNAPETSTRKEDVSMQQNVAAAIEQLHLESSQSQQHPSRITSNPGYVGQPVTNAQPLYYSPVFPGYVPYFEQSQQATPSQSQTPTSTPSTSQGDSAHQDTNKQTSQVPLTREQYEMQAQYQQFFNQQRQLFYQMHHQQQQQFMHLQMQQMQQQQTSQQSKHSQKQQQKQQATQQQQKQPSQRHQQKHLSQHHQQKQSSQQQQQQIYYQQRPTWHPDVPPPTMPVVQGFVPASYQVPPPTQYRPSSRHRHRDAEGAASAEVPAARGETNEQTPKTPKKTKKPKTRTTIVQEFPHVPQGTMQFIRPNTLSSVASQASIRNIPMPASVLESYRRPPEPTVIEEVQPDPSTPRELTEEEIFKRDNPLAYELRKLPQRFGVVPQTCSNSSDSSSNDPTY